MSVTEHRQEASRAVRCAIVTLSDTRTKEDDVGGKMLRERLAGAGHEIVDARILKDDPALLRAHLETMARSGSIDALVTTGGTGITSRDSTYEALASLLEKRLDGFGELFRMLSYQAVGAAAMLSRAIAGTYQGLVVVALPGSPAAVQLALDKLVLPELAHMVFLARMKPEASAASAGSAAHEHMHAHSPASPPPSTPDSAQARTQRQDVGPPVDRGSLADSARERVVAGTLPRGPALGVVLAVAEAIRYAPEKMQKNNLFASAQLFCDVYSLMPGQSQKPHAHDGADKIYYVVEGEGRFVLGDGEHSGRAGDVVHAPAGVLHGVHNAGTAPLALLVVMAPNPTPRAPGK